MLGVIEHQGLNTQAYGQYIASISIIALYCFFISIETFKKS